MASDRRMKDKEMASHLKKMGYPHGRRFTSGVSNVPSLQDVGSAAYRRLKERVRRSG